jgi:flavin reductase (DIM6/NTAB) family NADH-FMN oxidoreductase RutF
VDRSKAREVLSRFPYGLFVAGSRDGETPVTMIATWVTQVSFFPQLLAIAVESDSLMRECIERTGYFSLNILPSEGKELAASFLRSKDTTSKSINGHAYEPALHGSPFLLEASACLECKMAYRYETGDHTLVVGEVVEAITRKGGEILTMQGTGWNYQR